MRDRTITLNSNGESRYVMANGLLQDLFVNLISNAIEHSGKGRSSNVTVNLVRGQENGIPCYRVSVEDDGNGIPDDLKMGIFNRMYRGPTKAKGTGLGLYLARFLVDSYHGRIWVEDRVPGDHTRGAKFVVLLPVANRLCDKRQ